MSRSKKYPMFTVSKKFICNIHSILRRNIKIALRQGDEHKAEVTPRTSGKEEWGTRFGYDVQHLLNEEQEERRKKMTRK